MFCSLLFTSAVRIHETEVINRGLLIRLSSNAKTDIASGQSSHWLIDSPTILNLCVTRPSETFISFVFKHIHAASIYTIICSILDMDNYSAKSFPAWDILLPMA